PDFLEGLADLLGDHHLEVDGQVEGRADLQLVTGDIGEACGGASLVLIVSQAAGHRPIAEELAPVVTYDQTVVAMPGSTGGALEVASVIDAERGFAPTVAETATLPFAARSHGQRGVTIRHHVKLVKLGAFPPGEAPAIVRRLRPIFPGLRAADSVLETSLSNGNPVIHPAVTLLNAAWIERVEGGWEFYHEGVTPAVARLIEAADAERLALGEAMGLELLPEPEMSVEQGYSRVPDYLIAYRDGPGFQDLGGPESLEHRYITEDVAYAMVTWLELAEVFGVPMPVMEGIVRLSSVLLGCDYLAEPARGLAELGLAGMSAEEIVAHCCAG
ncbi:MAG: NAD/NADP octopine/nopaline dehydrogenase family protein, partial [Armatimonadota bacterium]